ncbi:MAG: nitroreductase family protein [Gammaproteobacteria bacterium]
MSRQHPAFVPLNFTEIPQEEMLQRAIGFRDLMAARRSVRDFSNRPVPKQLIEYCLQTAGTAPSGANKQPWHFVVVGSKSLKQAIREGAEQEEQEFYERRATDAWLEDLAPLGTDANKHFLEEAPYLIVAFAEKYVVDEQANKHKNYYVTESASLATGLLITALHNAGLTALTHTPSPMKFLNGLLGRPDNERPLMILVVGYPADGVKVPDITRKQLADFCSFA